ncbi:2Fe-2S iron-sulfur cluster-binding protein [Rhodococcus sp. NPDC127530]|uniref:2Fe-2S iron-sulfur cluster-binding protein n=1 Tax=unclassified Rhodococcus (in: high G+C Gram-positive bacteria) TaxID=192944 RepID=UPI00363CECB3
MPKIHFVDPSGTEFIADAAVGQSLMEVAVNSDVPGIDAECGGEMSCGTCHVYVNEEWRSQISGQSADEEEAITCLVVGEVRENSRLACQIDLETGVDGLSVTIPPA